MRILITGGAGFVGRNLARHFRAHGHAVWAASKDQCNIGDQRSIAAALAGYVPEVLVNCAGDKNLARCEEDGERALRINGYAAALLATQCRAAGVKFVHIGSDHAESLPVTAYGESKRQGQEWVMAANPEALVAVTGHVYDLDCPWVRWLDGELRAGRTVEAWWDLYNWPTYAGNLAQMLAELVEWDVSGIVACVGGQWVNRLILFRAYAEAMGLDGSLVVPCPTPCPSSLHPRDIRLPKRYDGLVRAVGLAEGFAAMREEISPTKHIRVTMHPIPPRVQAAISAAIKAGKAVAT